MRQHSTTHSTRGSLSDNKIPKRVDKYTAGYFTVLTQAQSSKIKQTNKQIKQQERGKKATKKNRFGTKMREKMQTRQENNISKEMRPQRNLLGRIKAL